MFFVYTGTNGILNLENYDRVIYEPRYSSSGSSPKHAIVAIKNKTDKITIAVYNTQQEAEKTLLNLYIAIAEGRNNWDMTMERSV